MEELEGTQVGVTEKEERLPNILSAETWHQPTYHFDFLVTNLLIRCDSVAFEISPVPSTY